MVLSINSLFMKGNNVAKRDSNKDQGKSRGGRPQGRNGSFKKEGEGKSRGTSRSFGRSDNKVEGVQDRGKGRSENKGLNRSTSREQVQADLNNIIFGRNSVLEVLVATEDAKENGKKMPFAIEEIFVQEGSSGSTSKIMGKARSQGIKVTIAPKEKIQRVLQSHGADFVKHQGVLGIISDYRYNEIEDILDLAKKREEDPFVIILDGIEDPHNLGAIMRTAECAGAHGIIIPNRRSATVNETVIKTSAGAAAHIMCAKVSNLVDAMKQLQEEGVWISALDMDGTDLSNANLSGPIALVVGGEDKGVSRLIKDNSDFVVSLPIKGKINSLNASNAAAIVIYKTVEARNFAK